QLAQSVVAVAGPHVHGGILDLLGDLLLGGGGNGGGDLCRGTRARRGLLQEGVEVGQQRRHVHLSPDVGGGRARHRVASDRGRVGEPVKRFDAELGQPPGGAAIGRRG